MINIRHINIIKPFKCWCCGQSRNLRTIDAKIIKALDKTYEEFNSQNSNSLLKKYLSYSVYDKLRKRTAAYGGTLLDVIESGTKNLDSSIGVYAPEAQAYVIFSALFDPIIAEYHQGFTMYHSHPQKDFGDGNHITNLDPEGKYILSTRIRCGRNIQGYPFISLLSDDEFLEIEKRVVVIMKQLSGDFKGKYYTLSKLTKQDILDLEEHHFLFHDNNRFLKSAGAYNSWPLGRGIFHNTDKTFLVWINAEDHLRIISMQQGGDLGTIYRRLVEGVTAFGRLLPFSYSTHLGFLTFCPTNLGTTLRVSVHINLPRIGSDPVKMQKILDEHHLGVHKISENGINDIYDITSKRRLGLSEFDVIQEFEQGIIELIKLEKSKT